MVVRANKRQRGHRRTHLDLCLGGHAVRSGLQSLLPRPGRDRLRRRPDLLPGACLARHLRAGVSRRPARPNSNLENFRRELQPGGGLSSYPHPWLMPDFWEFPTVSMGLGPIMAIYQARFNQYLRDRGHQGHQPTSKVWAFLGDGECDEPETLGAITLAAREQLDNLIFVINCNLQRLDGPVRGNGKIIQELEGIFRGAGWNVIKVIWGDDWDPLAGKGRDGPAGQAHGRSRRRPVPEVHGDAGLLHSRALLRQVSRAAGAGRRTTRTRSSNRCAAADTIRKRSMRPTRRPSNTGVSPTVILAKTIKGYGLGEAGEGRNIAHQQKKLNEEELREFRSRFGIPISDDRCGERAVLQAAGGQPGDALSAASAARRLGGYVPSRPTDASQARSRRRWPSTPSSSAAARARRCPRRWASCGCWTSCCSDKQHRQVHRADRARRIAHVRHGRHVPARSASMRTPASFTSRSIPTRCSTTRSQGRADPGRRHHRSRFDVVVHRRRHRLLASTAST